MGMVNETLVNPQRDGMPRIAIAGTAEVLSTPCSFVDMRLIQLLAMHCFHVYLEVPCLTKLTTLLAALCIGPFARYECNDLDSEPDLYLSKVSSSKGDFCYIPL
jgi:hypothetical protein